jgi:hypothetical protein
MVVRQAHHCREVVAEELVVRPGEAERLKADGCQEVVGAEGHCSQVEEAAEAAEADRRWALGRDVQEAEAALEVQ